MSGMDETKTVGFTQYRDALSWIIDRTSLGMKPGLKRMELLLEKLDDPQRRIKFIHVAGTNGKGSTCAYLSKVLAECGYRVGTFTSPYIEKFTNRIQVNGEDIPESDVIQLVNIIKPLADDIAATHLGPPTMFEVVTTMAIVYFSKFAYTDYVVWETGLGGRLDSTNIITPVVSVITNIGHDHMDILGDSLEQVAMEKAGIIKAGVPVITAVDQPGPLAVIEQIAKGKQSTLYTLGNQYKFEQVSSMENKQVFHFTSAFRQLSNVEISMNGAHQLKNAAVALMTLEVLRQYYALIADDEEILRAMIAVQWPGRLEMVSNHPNILLDGAHNPEGAETLAHALQHTYHFRKLHLMLGMLSTKNHLGYLRHILPVVDTIIVTEPDFRKKKDAAELADLVHQALKLEVSHRPIEIVVKSEWKDALDHLVSITGQDDLAVVSGTLYLISDVRSWILDQSDSEKGW